MADTDNPCFHIESESMTALSNKPLPKQANSLTRQQWGRLSFLIMGGGTIFKLSSIKDVFYVPMQEDWGLSNAQIGLGLSVYAMVQTLTYFASPYLADRFSKKYLLTVGLSGVAVCGLYLATMPSFAGYLIVFGVLGLFGEAIFWPSLLKAVSLIGNDRQQGRLFGYLEAGRGLVDVAVAFSALGIFTLFGGGLKGMQAGILFYAGVALAVAIATFFVMDDKDQIKATDGMSANAEVFAGIKHVIRRRETWMAAFVIFFIYSTYAGLTYFIPFLRDIYGLPVVLVGAYGIINQYALKMVGGPFGGYIVDKVMHSSLRYLSLTSAIAAVAIVAFAFLPHGILPVWLGMTMTLAFGAIIFTQRAVFFAPIREIGTPTEFIGAGMAVGCLIGYAPSLFAYYIYGSLLDNNPGILGYQFVFLIMGAFSAAGFILSLMLNRRIQNVSTGPTSRQSIEVDAIQ